MLRVFEATEREAERYGHEHIGAEHLLLGLLAEPDGIAARVLSDLGIADESARRVREIIESEGYSTPSNRVIFPLD
ncbi:MAG: Clp protease N-terminal domain-containing protein [Actinomycetota bacterium]|nr:Clp protease N-terminal domain-containing protein [Actinomycetota bacterium]